MPAPVITAAPDAPLRSESPSTFVTKAEAFVDWQADLPAELNAFGDYLNSYTPPGGYTDENARDAIGSALTAGGGIDITVNDGADTITVATEVQHVLLADQAAYDALTPDAATIYYIPEA
jgi:hypothetical protein